VDYLKFLREGHSDIYKTDNPDQAAVIGTWQLAVDHTYESFRRLYPQARESGYLDVLKFLRNTAFRQYAVPEKVPMRQYDWILTFMADNTVHSKGRFFPARPLFLLRPIVKFNAPPLNRSSSLRAMGKWRKPADGQNEYMADLRLYSNPPSTIQVFITPANDHLIIRFPDNYNREEYVFRRYEY
jgi:hypothetical protein